MWRRSRRWSLCSPPPPQCRTARVCVVAACVCVSRSLAAPIHPASLCHYTLALSLASFSCSLPPPPPLSVCLCLGRLFCTEPRHACTRCWLWLGRGLLFVRSHPSPIPSNALHSPLALAHHHSLLSVVHYTRRSSTYIRACTTITWGLPAAIAPAFALAPPPSSTEALLVFCVK